MGTRTPSENILLFVFVLLCGYFAIGVFPLAPVFGDGIDTANGATEMARNGIGPTPVAYRFSQAPGVYAVLVVLHKVTGADIHNIFLTLSALAALTLIMFSALFITRLTGAPLGLAGIVILLFQESTAAGYYANSNILAGAAFAAGLYMTARPPERWLGLLWPGVLFGLAAFFRVDALLLTPVVVPLLYRGDLRDLVEPTLTMGLVTAVVFVLLYVSSGARIEDLAAAVSDRAVFTTFSESRHFVLRTHVAFFSALLVFLIAAGTIAVIRARQWQLLAVVLVGIVPVYLILPAPVDVPRFLAPYIPFFALLATQGLWLATPSAGRGRFAYLGIVLLLFVAQYLVGWKLVPASAENDFRDKPLHYLTRLEVDHDQRLGLLIGAGDPVIGPSINGGHLASGWIFAPRWHLKHKRKADRQMQALDAYLAARSSDSFAIHAMGWNAATMVRLGLLRRGYHYRSLDWDDPYQRSTYLFERNSQTVMQTHYRYLLVDEIMNDRAPNPLATEHVPGAVFVAGHQPIARKMLLGREQDWRRISPIIFEYAPKQSVADDT